MPAPGPRPVGEVFSAFLRLGLTSFGGPIAHLGYFHRELIQRRHWLDESSYAQLVALAQLLPGPASSQLGFALGLLRAGWRGAIAAFIAFTLPSALLMFAFALFLPSFHGGPADAALHGLKLAAVAVVAQGVFTMARRLTPDLRRAAIAVAGAAMVLTMPGAFVQLLVVAMGGVLGFLALRRAVAVPPVAPLDVRHGTRAGIALLVCFALLLGLALGAQHSSSPLVACAGAFYRSGALVFGGGHVVLPLLKEAVVAPGWVSAGDFLSGYGAAQAVPGPLFSLAAFLGARLEGGQGGALGAAVALGAIFLPGFLLMAGALPYWRKLSGSANVLGAIAGVNAAVVGLLGAALYDPLWKGAIFSAADLAIVLVAFVVLAWTRVSVLVVLAACVVAAIGLASPISA